MGSIANGILNLNKPSGMSSRQAVDLVKRLVRPAKVGHAGTLDPLATGVLVVCIGKATRLMEFVQQMPKRYRATFLLGRSSPTEDVEGEVTEIADAPTPSRVLVEEACCRFTGTIQQRPPAFSALKVGGQRAYQLARQGKAVDLKPRRITVYDLRVVEFNYPTLCLDIRSSAGTYVRSLGRDIALGMGTAAVMSELTRTEIGPFHLDDAIDPRKLTPMALTDAMQSPQAALVGLHEIVLDENEIELIAHGSPVSRTQLPSSTAADELFVALDQNRDVLAVLKRRHDGALWPYINFIGKG